MSNADSNMPPAQHSALLCRSTLHNLLLLDRRGAPGEPGGKGASRVETLRNAAETACTTQEARKEGYGTHQPRAELWAALPAAHQEGMRGRLDAGRDPHVVRGYRHGPPGDGRAAVAARGSHRHGRSGPNMRAPHDSKRWRAQGKHRRGGRLASLAIGVLLWAIAGAGRRWPSATVVSTPLFRFTATKSACTTSSPARSPLRPRPRRASGRWPWARRTAARSCLDRICHPQGQAEAAAVKKCNARVAPGPVLQDAGLVQERLRLDGVGVARGVGGRLGPDPGGGQRPRCCSLRGAWRPGLHGAADDLLVGPVTGIDDGGCVAVEATGG